MSQPKISIIVPVYNAEVYLERCVNSLLAQTLEDIEIILVDDQSRDGSGRMCDAFAKKDNRIKVIHKKNEGAGKARNTALEVAVGEYVGFVDSDDFVEREMFETLVNKAEEYNSDLVLSGVKFVDGNMFSQKGECEVKHYFEQDTHFESGEEIKKLRLGIVGALPEDKDDSRYGMSIWKNVFRREIIEKNGIRFQSEREMLSEDALFMIDYISHIKKATGIKEAFYNYCRNGESISKSYKKDRFEKSLVFVSEVEKRFKKDIEREEYEVYINRFFQAMCRVLCSQEILHSKDEGKKFSDTKKRLRDICTHPVTVRTMKSFPIRKLPKKQFAFAFCIRHRLYSFLKILVQLRSR